MDQFGLHLNYLNITGRGKKVCTDRVVLPTADSILSECFLPLFCLLLGKIHSLKNVVCYRKDNTAGMHFLHSLCDISCLTQDVAGDVTAVFTLEDNEKTRQMWNYK